MKYWNYFVRIFAYRSNFFVKSFFSIRYKTLKERNRRYYDNDVLRWFNLNAMIALVTFVQYHTDILAKKIFWTVPVSFNRKVLILASPIDNGVQKTYIMLYVPLNGCKEIYSGTTFYKFIYLFSLMLLMETFIDLK